MLAAAHPRQNAIGAETWQPSAPMMDFLIVSYATLDLERLKDGLKLRKIEMRRCGTCRLDSMYFEPLPQIWTPLDTSEMTMKNGLSPLRCQV